MKKIEKWFLVSLILALSCGCSSLSREATDEIAAQARKLTGADRLDALEERVGALADQQRLIYGYAGSLAAAQGITPTAARDWAAAQDGATEEAEPVAPADDVDAVEFGKLQWTFGGVKGGKAELSSPRLSGLKAGSTSISYKWDVGLSGWGLANSEAGALCCWFVERENGEIVGGKFDWVSTSRKSRSLENVLDGYGGWSLEGVPNPTKCYLVVISSDGRKRSNVVGAEWKR